MPAIHSSVVSFIHSFATFPLCVILSCFIVTVQFLCLNFILLTCATVMCNKCLLIQLLIYNRNLCWSCSLNSLVLVWFIRQSHTVVLFIKYCSMLVSFIETHNGLIASELVQQWFHLFGQVPQWSDSFESVPQWFYSFDRVSQWKWSHSSDIESHNGDGWSMMLCHCYCPSNSVVLCCVRDMSKRLSTKTFL